EAAGPRDRHFEAGRRTQGGGQSRAFVAYRQRQRTREIRGVERFAAGSDGGSNGAPVALRPCRKVDIFVDLEMEVRALRGPQHFGRPGERALRRQKHLRDAGGGGTAQYRSDIARILYVFKQKAEVGG